MTPRFLIWETDVRANFPHEGRVLGVLFVCFLVCFFSFLGL